MDSASTMPSGSALGSQIGVLVALCLMVAVVVLARWRRVVDSRQWRQTRPSERGGRVGHVVGSHRDCVGPLMIQKMSRETGRWLWRRATYTVYYGQSDGSRVDVVSGAFRDHKAAVKAAKKLLQQR
ncbi:MAG: hypothetical protein EPO21_20620 [Chloroflexota bacterium]|nr:MAG: hypothetical protein EPO21_20620 [Chloroflexota bacterium]